MLVNPKNYIKTPEEIAIMREGGRIHAQIMQQLYEMIVPGLDVWELEKRFIELTSQYNVAPACKNYAPYDLPPFPTGLCVSINTQSVHCFPKKGVILKEGDIVTIDTDIKYKNLFVDAAFCKAVGTISKKRQKLIDTTRQARDKAISKVKAGIRVGVLANTMQRVVQNAGFDVIREYAGHGIGKTMHEYPEVPCFGHKSDGPKLRAGMTICIEPLVCERSPHIDHVTSWETRMRDGGDFCQFEHTVLVTESGCEILTTL